MAPRNLIQILVDRLKLNAHLEESETTFDLTCDGGECRLIVGQSIEGSVKLFEVNCRELGTSAPSISFSQG